MRKFWSGVTGLALGLTIINTTYAPVRVMPEDIFDVTVALDNGQTVKLEPGEWEDAVQRVPIGGYEAGRTWVGFTGEARDGGVLFMDWERWRNREIALVTLCALGFLARWRYAQQLGCLWRTICNWALFAPALIYATYALGRVLFVPCVWTVRTGYHSNQAIEYSGSVALWEIGTEQVRYGLIAFEELVMLACAVTFYAALFYFFPKLRRF